jgi:flagellar biogenesis protein FliO
VVTIALGLTKTVIAFLGQKTRINLITVNNPAVLVLGITVVWELKQRTENNINYWQDY